MATEKKTGGQRRGSSKASGSARKSSSGTPSSLAATRSSSSATRRKSGARTGGAKSPPSSRKARDGKGVLGSRAFERAKKAAKKIVADPAEARKLEQRASKKASANEDVLGGVFDDLRTLLRLIRAYSKKEYREVPQRTLVSAAAAVIYFVNPVDLIPDVLPGIGYVDDVAVLVFVVGAISVDLDDFRAWERKRDAAKKRRPPAGAKGAGAANKSDKGTRNRAQAKASASKSTAKGRAPKKSAPRTQKKPAKT